eukprot:CAMPEP_0113965422 /NCGR_PEP_ID=MMETSP0011_2-20120614/7734_1 /TAXON_ID=101924 /ORGANISM="Rhodosorus marinus" /LENGTH=378 /DNA_ID=CAMNT_0000977929 /DNA_START=235 /DNA_END=1371 /DNA_ORIENTATION=+ /assembly_acc=CAM_ASM_000156
MRRGSLMTKGRFRGGGRFMNPNQSRFALGCFIFGCMLVVLNRRLNKAGEVANGENRPEAAAEISAGEPPSAMDLGDSKVGHVVEVAGKPVATLELERGKRPVGILMLLPGCHHTALDFFPKGRLCDACKGLPAETSIIRIAVGKGLFPVAVSPTGVCWNPEKDSDDLHRISQTLNELIVRQSLSNLPLFVFGASSGGVMASVLPSLFNVSGLIIQIASSASEDLLSHEHSLAGKYPPSVYMHMPRDLVTAARVDDDLEVLDRMHAPSREIRLLPKQIGERFFSSQVEGITSEESKKMFTALKEAGFLDANGILNSDPRASSWREALSKSVPRLAHDDGFRPDESPIAELLNIAYAQHELSAEGIDQALEFLIQNHHEN